MRKGVNVLGRPVAVGVAVVVRLLRLRFDVSELESRVSKDVALGLPLKASGSQALLVVRHRFHAVIDDHVGATRGEYALVDLVLSDEEGLGAVNTSKRGRARWGDERSAPGRLHAEVASLMGGLCDEGHRSSVASQGEEVHTRRCQGTPCLRERRRGERSVSGPGLSEASGCNVGPIGRRRVGRVDALQKSRTSPLATADESLCLPSVVRARAEARTAWRLGIYMAG